MTTLESLKHRIDAVTDLQTVVRTMKSLAAASIRQYENALSSLEDFNRTIEMGLQVALRDRIIDKNEIVFHSGDEAGIIVFGSDHSLCGRFNEDLAEFVDVCVKNADYCLSKRRVLAVGARIESQLEIKNESIEECFFLPGSAANITETVQQILLKVDDWRRHFDIKQLVLFYNRRAINSLHKPIMLRMTPIDLSRFQQANIKPAHKQKFESPDNDHASRIWPGNSIPYISMNADKLFSALINQYFFVTLFQACTESLASEHASRLASMQNAEKNIEERLSDLDANFRELRQNSITQELLEVVSGFETLTGKNRARN